MNKTVLRKKFKNIKISEKRKQEAAQKALNTLLPLCKKYPKILSFAALNYEIDLWPLNQILCAQEKLVLPKIYENNLKPCLVKDLSQLKKHLKFKIMEPKEPVCDLKLPEIKLILVPALAFDKRGHRLGHGKGYYDRFLKELSHAYTIGIGLKENFSQDFLPIEKHDVPLKAVLFF